MKIAGKIRNKLGLPQGRRGSLMMVSVVLMVVAGTSSLSWVGYTTQSMRAAKRDRDQVIALYAAESGIELMVDYFNNPDNYLGDVPNSYRNFEDHPAAYASTAAVAPTQYELFDPYIVSVKTGADGSAQYDPDGNLMVSKFSYFRDPAAGSNADISKTCKIPSFTLDLSNEEVEFVDADGRAISSIERIEFVNPRDMPDIDAASADSLVIGRVIAIGRTPNGIGQAIESVMTDNPTLNIAAGAAIITKATATFSGQFNVHWGELWAEEDIELPSNFLSHIPRYDPSVDYNSRTGEDRWFNLRTKGWIYDNSGNKYADGRDDQGFASSPPSSGISIYETPYDPLYLNNKLKRKYEGLENLKQNQFLTMPEYNYDDWKDFVLSLGFNYYFTDSNGTIYGREKDASSDNFGKIVGKSWDAWFDSNPSDPDYWKLENIINFIDSIPVDDNGNTGPSVDGVPVINSVYYPRDPRDDGEMATIKLAGGGTHSRGAFFIAANMDMKGQGNPPSWETIPSEAGGGVTMPNDEVPTGERIKIFHHGLMVCWGSVSGGGNRTIYGSIITDGGYAANGSPEVFYNYRLADGSWLDLNVSRVSRNSWAVIPVTLYE